MIKNRNYWEINFNINKIKSLYERKVRDKGLNKKKKIKYDLGGKELDNHDLFLICPDICVLETCTNT